MTLPPMLARHEPDVVPIDAPALVREWHGITASVHPVDGAGKAGDVVFYHSRLGHHAGQNYSARIRMAVCPCPPGGV